MMIFYYAPQTVSVACHITLNEVGADYEARKVDFGASEQQSATYLEVNPKGRVPSLLTDKGIITETPAILLYLAQCFPEANLAPMSDPFALAKLQEFNAYLCATVHVAHAHRVRGSRWVDDQNAIVAMQAKVPETMHACFDLIEKGMFAGPWVLGEDYTVSDPYLFTISNWLAGDSVDINDFPRIANHHQRMRERPAVQAVLEIHGL